MVIAARDTAEKIGVAYRARADIDNKHIIRKSLDRFIKPGERLYAATELDVDEALRTGISMEEWSS